MSPVIPSGSYVLIREQSEGKRRTEATLKRVENPARIIGKAIEVTSKL